MPEKSLFLGCCVYLRVALNRALVFAARILFIAGPVDAGQYVRQKCLLFAGERIKYGLAHKRDMVRSRGTKDIPPVRGQEHILGAAVTSLRRGTFHKVAILHSPQ